MLTHCCCFCRCCAYPVFSNLFFPESYCLLGEFVFSHAILFQPPQQLYIEVSQLKRLVAFDRDLITIFQFERAIFFSHFRILNKIPPLNTNTNRKKNTNAWKSCLRIFPGDWNRVPTRWQSCCTMDGFRWATANPLIIYTRRSSNRRFEGKVYGHDCEQETFRTLFTIHSWLVFKVDFRTTSFHWNVLMANFLWSFAVSQFFYLSASTVCQRSIEIVFSWSQMN